MQVIDDPASEYALLDLSLTNKEEADGDVKAKSSLGCCNHEIIEFKVLREGEKTNTTAYSAQPNT